MKHNYTEANPITLYRWTVLRSAVKMECLGMKRRGRSATAIVKDELKLKRSLKSIEVLANIDFHIMKIREAMNQD
jgi:hypothetical protein